MNDYFGYSVSISDDTVIVGAYGKDGGLFSPDRGAAYVFTLQQIYRIYLPLVVSASTRRASAWVEVVKRYVVFSKSLAGWARDRALESMSAFGNDLLEPTVELLQDPDEEVRASALQVATSFEDPRILPATVQLLKDPDWWIRITAAETLGRLKDALAVPALVEALKDPETRWSAVEALGHIGDVNAAPIR